MKNVQVKHAQPKSSLVQVCETRLAARPSLTNEQLAGNLDQRYPRLVATVGFVLTLLGSFSLVWGSESLLAEVLVAVRSLSSVPHFGLLVDGAALLAVTVVLVACGNFVTVKVSRFDSVRPGLSVVLRLGAALVLGVAPVLVALEWGVMDSVLLGAEVLLALLGCHVQLGAALTAFLAVGALASLAPVLALCVEGPNLPSCLLARRVCSPRGVFAGLPASVRPPPDALQSPLRGRLLRVGGSPVLLPLVSTSSAGRVGSVTSPVSSPVLPRLLLLAWSSALVGAALVAASLDAGLRTVVLRTLGPLGSGAALALLACLVCLLVLLVSPNRSWLRVALLLVASFSALVVASVAALLGSPLLAAPLLGLAALSSLGAVRLRPLHLPLVSVPAQRSPSKDVPGVPVPARS